MTTWRKSSRSGGSSEHSDCVEVTRLPGTVGVRDSKAPETGHLSLRVPAFAELVARVKRGELNL
ncbi:MAG: DUF397 domain-containing protein [Actinomadura sp.]